MKRFLHSINILNIENYDMDFFNIEKDTSNPNRPLYTYSIIKNNYFDYESYLEFYSSLKTIEKYDYKIIFTYKNNNKKILEKFISDYINLNSFTGISFSIHINSHIEINVDSKSINDFKDVKEDLIDTLNFLGIPFEVVINYDDDFVLINSGLNETSKEESYEEIKIKEEERIKKEKEARTQNEKSSYEKNNYSNLNYKETDIKDINNDGDYVSFKGKIFEAELKTFKNKSTYHFGVLDKESAIYVTYYPKDNKDGLDLINYKNVLVKGKIVKKLNQKEPICYAHSYKILDDDSLKEDTAINKRVELHLHTKFSEMDGISSIDEYCEVASFYKMKAIAVTDHGVVQSFPEAQIAAKKYNLKMIYGSELYMIEDYLNCAINPKDISLKDATFVSFDTETTGLSIRNSKIIEIGAVKIKNNMIIDRFNMLVNPHEKLSEFIESKTHIKQEMVDNANDIEVVLPLFLDFIKDTILIAHNAVFDYQMINEPYKKIYGKTFDFPIIDTLPLSRYFYPSNRDHNLGALANRLECEYNETSAHRADYDAEVLAECWSALKLKLLDENKEVKHKDLEKLPFSNELLKQFKGAYHIILLCKNKKSLKTLYKIISTSHIDYIGNHPFVPRSLIKKYKDEFFIGSACFNGEVFQDAVYRNEETLKSSISFYDYIEIQPLDQYFPLINGGKIKDLNELKDYLKIIINEAKRQNKLVVATSDCHYAKKEEKLYRDVYVANQGVGGVFHPLIGNLKCGNPDQHLFSTDEMIENFSWLNDNDLINEIVITNTNKISSMIEEIIPIPDKLYTPEIKDSEKILTELCYKKAHKEYGENLPEYIENRLKTELDGIIGNGYSVTYYIAHQLVKLTNERGYIVGSRGSVGSSFAAYCAGITEVNPLPPHYKCPKCKYVEFSNDPSIKSGYDLKVKECPHCGTKLSRDGQNIPFETFLGFHAEKVPDIDLNFDSEFQKTAFLFTKDLLGEKNVYRAGTIMGVKFKTAYGYVRKYFERMGKDPSKIRSSYIAGIANNCMGVKRSTGKHAGGIIVVPQKYDIYDFSPIQYPADEIEDDWKTTHFDFRSIHDTILKLDMLGHDDPTVLKRLCELTGVNLKDIPLDDKKVFSLFLNNEALNLKHKYIKNDVGIAGIPEFGTTFVRQIVRETKPKNFSDLVIISGLSHGTKVWSSNAQDLINNKITDLNGVIGCRDDIMGYLIKMGLDKSDAFSIMEKVRKGKHLNEDDILKMENHHVPSYYIESCNKIAYLFPKGHACAYVIMALRIAYFKIYYPLEYYSVFLEIRCKQYDIEAMSNGIDAVYKKFSELERRSKSKDSSDKLSPKEEEQLDTLEIVLELYERGYKIGNVDINKSLSSSFIIDKENNTLIPPFKVIDGIGESNSNTLIEERKIKLFDNIRDLSSRGKLSDRIIDNLRKLKVLDSFKENDDISLFDLSSFS